MRNDKCRLDQLVFCSLLEQLELQKPQSVGGEDLDLELFQCTAQGFDGRQILQRIPGVVLRDGLCHGQPVEALAQVDGFTLIVQRGAASDFLRKPAQQFFSEIHEVMIILIRLVELEHGELRIVPGRHAFIAEIAVDFEYLLDASHNKAFQIQLRRYAQVELHVERVVMGHEWARRRATRNRLHHRCLHLEIASRDEKLAD